MEQDELLRVLNEKGYECYESFRHPRDIAVQHLEEDKRYSFGIKCGYDEPRPNSYGIIRVRVSYRHPGIGKDCLPPDMMMHLAPFSMKGKIVTLYGSEKVQIPLVILVNAIREQFVVCPQRSLPDKQCTKA